MSRCGETGQRDRAVRRGRDAAYNCVRLRGVPGLDLKLGYLKPDLDSKRCWITGHPSRDEGVISPCFMSSRPHGSPFGAGPELKGLH